MMRKLLLFASLLTASLITSCTSDDPDDMGGSSGGKSVITLDCRYDGDHTLTNHRDGVDYKADCLVQIFNGELKIEPGVTIEFGASGGLGTTASGRLTCSGTSGEEITLQAENSLGWQGIHIDVSDAVSLLSHVVIKDAGIGDGFFLFRTEPAAVTVSGIASINDCTILNSDGVGIITRDETGTGVLRELEDVEIRNCSTYPIKISPNSIEGLDFSSCTFEENGENFIVIDTEDTNRLREELTLEDVDTPYLLSHSIELYEGLTLEAGVDFAVANNASIVCSQPEAYISIAGSQSKHVTIRGKEALSGYWGGIHLTSGNVKNVFDFLDISDAGSVVFGSANEGANITLGDRGILSVNDCTSARSFTSCDLSTYDFVQEPVLTNNSPELRICER